MLPLTPPALLPGVLDELLDSIRLVASERPDALALDSARHCLELVGAAKRSASLGPEVRPTTRRWYAWRPLAHVASVVTVTRSPLALVTASMRTTVPVGSVYL